MSTPEFYDGHGFFYPTGNSPAINLVAHIPPEVDAQVLSLGCGDVRNILFTIFTESTDHSGGELRKKYHFTCCDIEGAVIARNILLLAMIMKNENHSTMWSIYYDIFLSEADSQALQRHLDELLSASEDIGSWAKISVGSALTFGSKYTLAVVRRFWSAWAGVLKDVEKQSQRRKSVEQELDKVVKSRGPRGTVLSLSRSGGPLALEVLLPSIDHFDHYWKHGTTDRHKKEPPVSNPTFTLSKFGKKFSVHYGTNPLAGFHLSTAVVPLEFSSGSAKTLFPVNKNSDFTRLVSCAMDEFKLWCNSFVKRQVQGRGAVTICFLVDGALEFCGSISPESDVTGIKEVNESNATSKGYFYNHPMQFNVIDISNLIDHVGTYNILLSVLALLRKDHLSYLSTETLLDYEFDLESETGALFHVFGVDPASLFTLLGITVVDFICGQTSISNISEHQLEVFGKGAQRQVRLIWKWIPSFSPEGISSDRASILPRPKFTYDLLPMIDFLADIYRKLFAIENHAWARRKMAKSIQKAVDRSGPPSSIAINVLQHNTRRTFSLLLQKIKRATSETVNWDELVEKLTMVVTHECGSFVASCFLQEQMVQNHLHGVGTAECFMDDPKTVAIKYGKGLFSKIVQTRSSNLVTCVTISVPMDVFQKLKTRDIKKIGTPPLQMALYSGNLLNNFSIIQRRFGKLDAIDSSDYPGLTIQQGAPILNEDPDGWMGTSDILYSCMVPTWFLLFGDCKVSLGIVSTPGTSLLIPELGIGPMMTLFEASVSNSKIVRLSTKVPSPTSFLNEPMVLKPTGNPGDTESTGPSASESSEPQTEYRLVMVPNFRPKIQAFFTAESPKIDPAFSARINRISYRWSMGDDENLIKLLEDRATISCTRMGSSTVTIYLGPESKVVTFPFPISTETKLLVARKSKYIEIEAALFNSGQVPSYVHFPIEIVSKPVRGIASWNMQRINLDKSPVVAVNVAKYGQKMYEWINSTASFALSKRERANINSQATKYSGDLLSEIKETIHMILVRHLGIQGFQNSTFVLACAGVRGYMLIYVKDIRLDLSGQNVIADCALIPFEDDNLEKITPLIAHNFHHAPLKNSPQEAKAWLQVSASFVERCRTWQHKSDCQYFKSGRVPLSSPELKIGNPPICGCGRGIFPEEFFQDRKIKPLLPFATRAAIGPLFPPPYSMELQNINELIPKLGALNIPSHPKEGECATCGKEAGGDVKLSKCSACMKVEYCSKECQKRDWKAHKKTH
ncbi:hypothetical protein TWF481_008270 [Arthrobotrys musiformis]|uniref:MYND-type domain-containing protein n=1 Tax=Arthrobotrys musiformis TaxID=47236 RepID=A0AAV9W810_9PEZI